MAYRVFICKGRVAFKNAEDHGCASVQQRRARQSATCHEISVLGLRSFGRCQGQCHLRCEVCASWKNQMQSRGCFVWIDDLLAYSRMLLLQADNCYLATDKDVAPFYTRYTACKLTVQYIKYLRTVKIEQHCLAFISHFHLLLYTPTRASSNQLCTFRCSNTGPVRSASIHCVRFHARPHRLGARGAHLRRYRSPDARTRTGRAGLVHMPPPATCPSE